MPPGDTSDVLLARGPLRDAVLDRALLIERQARADRLLEADGAGHLVHDLPVRGDGRTASIVSRPWRVDPIPVTIDAATFRWLHAAVAERMRALGAVIADLYGDHHLVHARVVAPELLAATGRYRVNAVGSTPRRWLTTYAVDLALGADGVWYVVQDLTDAPPGVGYALLDRSVMARVVPEVMADVTIAPVARHLAAMRTALATVTAAASPRVVLFSGGIEHPSYVDHSYLAVQLGVHLVEGADLVVRRRRVWLRTLDGLEPVDVLYRRLDDPTVDPLEVGAHGALGVPGLLQAVRAGGVALANAHGSGVIEDPTITPLLAAAIDLLHPMRTTLPMLPDRTTPLATVPVVSAGGTGQLVQAPVVLRLFAVDDGEAVTVMPGGTARVLAPGDDPRAPTACIAKDVWVLDHARVSPVGPQLPQVDFGRSLPTRAADALYWANRAAERAEAIARTARVVQTRSEQDPDLGRLDDGAWQQRMTTMLQAIRRATAAASIDPDNTQSSPSATELADELTATSAAVAAELGSLLTEATTVREYLSVTTGRVLAHLAELRSGLIARPHTVDEFDAVLADSAAFAGLWHESIVRGPAWRIGDLGRALERALVVLDLVGAALGSHLAPRQQRPAAEAGAAYDRVAVEAAVIEVLLAANESLVAYRRRHRSDVELDAALALLIGDETNPRSLAAAIDRFGRHAADAEWQAGAALADRARAALTLPIAELHAAVRACIDEAGTRVVERWFSSPVSAIPMGPTEPPADEPAHLPGDVDRRPSGSPGSTLGGAS